MRTPLALGPLAAEGVGVRRSGLKWLHGDGDACRPGEPIAVANIRLVQRGGAGPLPFPNEALQAVLTSPVAGRLRIEDASSGGGWRNTLAVHDWDAGEVVASIESEAADKAGPRPLPLRLLMLAGLRLAWAVDTDAGLLPGWNLYGRGWWGETAAPSETLLTIGVCDTAGFLRGERGGFTELFEATTAPFHVVHATEHPIAPCAPILLEQLLRTPAEMEEISDNLRRFLGKGPVAPTPQDHIFAGALLAQLSASPLEQRHDILGPWGVKKLGPPDVILLSCAAEPRWLLRHRRLGYAMQVHAHNMAGAGPAMRYWLEHAFERVERSTDDFRLGLERLIDETHARTGARFLIMNRMSTSGAETTDSYAGFDAPLDATIRSVAAKRLNLMLHDLGRSRPAAVLDVDALAAALGGRRHLADGLHQSGPLEAALRQELLSMVGSTQSTRKSMAMAAS